MKNTAIGCIFVFCYSLISSSNSLKPTHELSVAIGNVADVAHRHVLKRQTVSDLTAQDIIDCSSTIVEYQCSSDYAQRFTDIALGCRNQTLARDTANACARSEGGDRCGTAVLRILLDETQSTNAATCVGAVASGVCPSACRSFLGVSRSRLGCCVNTYINVTGSSLLAVYGTYVDYRLWNLCDVNLPPATDCGNSPVTLK